MLHIIKKNFIWNWKQVCLSIVTAFLLYAANYLSNNYLPSKTLKIFILPIYVFLAISLPFTLGLFTVIYYLILSFLISRFSNFELTAYIVPIAELMICYFIYWFIFWIKTNKKQIVFLNIFILSLIYISYFIFMTFSLTTINNSIIFKLFSIFSIFSWIILNLIFLLKKFTSENLDNYVKIFLTMITCIVVIKLIILPLLENDWKINNFLEIIKENISIVSVQLFFDLFILSILLFLWENVFYAKQMEIFKLKRKIDKILETINQKNIILNFLSEKEIISENIKIALNIKDVQLFTNINIRLWKEKTIYKNKLKIFNKLVIRDLKNKTQAVTRNKLKIKINKEEISQENYILQKKIDQNDYLFFTKTQIYKVVKNSFNNFFMFAKIKNIQKYNLENIFIEKIDNENYFLGASENGLLKLSLNYHNFLVNLEKIKNKFKIKSVQNGFIEKINNENYILGTKNEGMYKISLINKNIEIKEKYQVGKYKEIDVSGGFFKKISEKCYWLGTYQKGLFELDVDPENNFIINGVQKYSFGELKEQIPNVMHGMVKKMDEYNYLLGTSYNGLYQISLNEKFKISRVERIPFGDKKNQIPNIVGGFIEKLDKYKYLIGTYSQGLYEISFNSNYQLERINRFPFGNKKDQVPDVMGGFIEKIDEMKYLISTKSDGLFILKLNKDKRVIESIPFLEWSKN